MTSAALSPEPQWRRRRRQIILSAARDLFAVSSYDAVQMDEIAVKAKVGKPTLYRYFPSKRALYLGVCGDGFDALSARLQRAAQSESEPLARLKTILAALLDVLGDQLITLDVFNTSDSELAQEWRELYGAHRDEIVRHLADAIEEGIAAGLFRPVDAEFLARMLIGATRGALGEDRPRPAHEIVTNLLDIFLKGFIAPASRRIRPPAAFTPRLAAARN